MSIFFTNQYNSYTKEQLIGLISRMRTKQMSDTRNIINFKETIKNSNENDSNVNALITPNTSGNLNNDLEGTRLKLMDQLTETLDSDIAAINDILNGKSVGSTTETRIKNMIDYITNNSTGDMLSDLVTINEKIVNEIKEDKSITENLKSIEDSIIDVSRGNLENDLSVLRMQLTGVSSDDLSSEIKNIQSSLSNKNLVEYQGRVTRTVQDIVNDNSIDKKTVTIMTTDGNYVYTSTGIIRTGSTVTFSFGNLFIKVKALFNLSDVIEVTDYVKLLIPIGSTLPIFVYQPVTTSISDLNSKIKIEHVNGTSVSTNLDDIYGSLYPKTAQENSSGVSTLEYGIRELKRQLVSAPNSYDSVRAAVNKDLTKVGYTGTLEASINSAIGAIDPTVTVDEATIKNKIENLIPKIVDVNVGDLTKDVSRVSMQIVPSKSGSNDSLQRSLTSIQSILSDEKLITYTFQGQKTVDSVIIFPQRIDIKFGNTDIFSYPFTTTVNKGDVMIFSKKFSIDKIDIKAMDTLNDIDEVLAYVKFLLPKSTKFPLSLYQPLSTSVNDINSSIIFESTNPIDKNINTVWNSIWPNLGTEPWPTGSNTLSYGVGKVMEKLVDNVRNYDNLQDATEEVIKRFSAIPPSTIESGINSTISMIDSSDIRGTSIIEDKLLELGGKISLLSNGDLSEDVKTVNFQIVGGNTTLQGYDISTNITNAQKSLINLKLVAVQGNVTGKVTSITDQYPGVSIVTDTGTYVASGQNANKGDELTFFKNDDVIYVYVTRNLNGYNEIKNYISSILPVGSELGNDIYLDLSNSISETKTLLGGTGTIYEEIAATKTIVNSVDGISYTSKIFEIISYNKPNSSFVVRNGTDDLEYTYGGSSSIPVGGEFSFTNLSNPIIFVNLSGFDIASTYIMDYLESNYPVGTTITPDKVNSIIDQLGFKSTSILSNVRTVIDAVKPDVSLSVGLIDVAGLIDDTSVSKLDVGSVNLFTQVSNLSQRLTSTNSSALDTINDRITYIDSMIDLPLSQNTDTTYDKSRTLASNFDDNKINSIIGSVSGIFDSVTIDSTTVTIVISGSSSVDFYTGFTNNIIPGLNITFTDGTNSYTLINVSRTLTSLQDIYEYTKAMIPIGYNCSLPIYNPMTSTFNRISNRVGGTANSLYQRIKDVNTKISSSSNSSIVQNLDSLTTKIGGNPSTIFARLGSLCAKTTSSSVGVLDTDLTNLSNKITQNKGNSIMDEVVTSINKIKTNSTDPLETELNNLWNKIVLSGSQVTSIIQDVDYCSNIIKVDNVTPLSTKIENLWDKIMPTDQLTDGTVTLNSIDESLGEFKVNGSFSKLSDVIGGVPGMSISERIGDIVTGTTGLGSYIKTSSTTQVNFGEDDPQGNTFKSATNLTSALQRFIGVINNANANTGGSSYLGIARGVTMTSLADIINNLVIINNGG